MDVHLSTVDSSSVALPPPFHACVRRLTAARICCPAAHAAPALPALPSSARPAAPRTATPEGVGCVCVGGGWGGGGGGGVGGVGGGQRGGSAQPEKGHGRSASMRQHPSQRPQSMAARDKPARPRQQCNVFECFTSLSHQFLVHKIVFRRAACRIVGPAAAAGVEGAVLTWSRRVAGSSSSRVAATRGRARHVSFTACLHRTATQPAKAAPRPLLRCTPAVACSPPMHLRQRRSSSACCTRSASSNSNEE